MGSLRRGMGRQHVRTWPVPCRQTLTRRDICSVLRAMPLLSLWLARNDGRGADVGLHRTILPAKLRVRGV
jgi:hypothetical protein